MPLLNYNKKSKCGPILSSSCVTWDGGYGGVLTSDNTACDASIEDVTLVISNEVDDIKESIDLTSFNPNGLSFNPSTQQIKDLLQQIADSLHGINASLANIQSQINDVQAGDITMNLDLQCLASQISSCETPPNYSLRSILELLISKNC